MKKWYRKEHRTREKEYATNRNEKGDIEKIRHSTHRTKEIRQKATTAKWQGGAIKKRFGGERNSSDSDRRTETRQFSFVLQGTISSSSSLSEDLDMHLSEDEEEGI